ncbi:MAG: hypothetical protein M3N50_15240 [Pseudomonadota bacterium]|nr:hypothetical protein [Pseudomonadota bacterium]
MKHARVLLLCAVAAVSACHRDAGTPAASEPAPHIAVPVLAKKGPSVAEQTTGMVEAATLGKSTVQVEMKFALAHKPQIGQPLDLSIAVLPQIAASPATIQLAGVDGLELASGASHIELPSVEPGAVYRQTVTLTPTSEGVLLLGVTVSLKHEEITESRVFSVPLIVDR